MLQTSDLARLSSVYSQRWLRP